MHEHHPPNHHYKWSSSRSSSIHCIFISDHPQDHHQDKSSSYWIIWPCSCRRPWWPCTGRCCPSPSWRWPDCPPPLACTVCLVMKMLVKIILTILTILIGDSNMNTSYLDSLWGAEGRYQRRPHASPSQLSVCAQYSGPCSGGLQNLKSISIPNNYDIWLRLTDWLTDWLMEYMMYLRNRKLPGKPSVSAKIAGFIWRRISRSQRDVRVWVSFENCEKPGKGFEESCAEIFFENGAAAGVSSDRELNRAKTAAVSQLSCHLLSFHVSWKCHHQNPFIIINWRFAIVHCLNL